MTIYASQMIVFYVIFEVKMRQTNAENTVCLIFRFSGFLAWCWQSIKLI